MKTISIQLEEIKNQRDDLLPKASTQQELENIRIMFLGRKGKIADLMGQLKDLSGEEKKHFGPLFNQLKVETETLIKEKQDQLLAQQACQEKLSEKYFDVSASNFNELHGSKHLYSHIIADLENIFISMGFEIVDGREIDTEYYNFESLNIPAHHPARDEGDTFFLKDFPFILRTQTSNIQAHIMEQKTPPLAFFSPGRVYRKEATDATHDFMFTQAEGFFLGKNVSIGNLLAVARTFLQEIFQQELSIRVRPGYFPFVEPGLEIDASCPFCSTGCSACKRTGWIELLGAGLIHPNVLRASNIDPTSYSGFAFGLGIERIAMIKYGINDIRLFHSNKIKFLDMFS